MTSLLTACPMLIHIATASGAAEREMPLGATLSPWSVTPFVLMLGCIAVLPLVTPHWWHHNRNRALVSLALGAPVAIWIGMLDLHLLGHTLHEYAAFIILLGSLFVISGGVVVRCGFAATPLVNTLFILSGTILASFIGTTGASMVLIRPLLRANAQRQRRVHVVVFFIFLVSNIGGLLTPLGDPPLFLGFLRGVPFAWTLRLTPEWATLATMVLALFYAVDTFLARRETQPNPQPEAASASPSPRLVMAGKRNLLLLGGVVAIIYLSGQLKPPLGVQELGMIAMAVLSLWLTPSKLHRENGFSWEPIVEVVVVFAGIFATMMPTLAVLNARGSELGISQPWQFFWTTGLLSSFLDNAPTYLAFTATASGLLGVDGTNLSELLGAPGGPALLEAISLGAVFMGANTYIGNGPNFMVKAIAEQNKVRMPSFFGYMLYSMAILIPAFVIMTVLFLLP